MSVTHSRPREGGCAELPTVHVPPENGALGAVSAASIAESALAAAEEEKEREQISGRKIRIAVVGGGFGAEFQ